MDVKTILHLISQLRDFGVIDLASVVLSTVIPLVVLFVTLHREKQQNIASLKRQARIHRESMEKMEQEHREAMRLQNESNRIHAMPFFVLKKDVHIHPRKDNFILTLSFVNSGNGTAVHVMTKYIGKDEDELHSCTICSNAVAKYTCACPFDYEKSLVRPDEVCSMSACCEILHPNSKATFYNYLEFTILYSDMYGREYQQKFGFSYEYQKNTGIFAFVKIDNYSPSLVKDTFCVNS